MDDIAAVFTQRITTPMCSFPMACIISLDISLPTGPGRNGGLPTISLKDLVGITVAR